VKLLSSAPAVLDLFVWLSYRCFTSKGTERIPIFGSFGLVQQLGAVEYARPRKFREKLQQWLKTIRLVWPECPAEITADGENLKIQPATSIRNGTRAAADLSVWQWNDIGRKNRRRSGKE